MQGIDWALLLSRFLHIATAIVAIGGAFFLRFVLSPSAAKSLADEDHQRLREAVRSRWAKFVQASIAILLVTGALNFVWLALPPKVDPIPYHPLFGVKFLAALGIFFIASTLVGRSPGFANIRRANRGWLTLLLGLAALILFISGMLSQIRRPAPAPTTVLVFARPQSYMA